MAKARNEKLASEAYVWSVVNRAEENLENKSDKFEAKMDKRFDKVMTALDWLIGRFKKFDEEQTILSERVGDHGDRIEKLEESKYITS